MKVKNLKRLRTKAKLTQKELSFLSGRTIATISSAERGVSISEDTIQALAKALKVSYDDLVK